SRGGGGSANRCEVQRRIATAAEARGFSTGSGEARLADRSGRKLLRRGARAAEDLPEDRDRRRTPRPQLRRLHLLDSRRRRIAGGAGTAQSVLGAQTLDAGVFPAVQWAE